MQQPLVNQHYTIEKQAGKGGWTYVVIAEIPPGVRGRSGLVRVYGSVDTYEIKQFNLMPLKDGRLFLPLKAAVRKKIKKKEGDTVHVLLYADDSPVDIPDDILVCLLDSEKAYQFFLSLSDSNQKYYIDWIEEAKKQDTKVDRICKMMERLEKGWKFYDWPKQDTL
jgi:Bacteriocin-protection, YdeI or OmpD-Associated/Domain of unknown function (DUF1905)